MPDVRLGYNPVGHVESFLRAAGIEHFRIAVLTVAALGLSVAEHPPIHDWPRDGLSTTCQRQD